jgi:hypothetical protein
MKEKFCAKRSKYRPAEGFEKEAFGHRHICAECKDREYMEIAEKTQKYIMEKLIDAR